MSELIERIKEAIGTGEVLTVRYFGGSQPGSQRQIVPLRCTDKELRAREVDNRNAKTFLIAKLQLITGCETAQWYEPGKAIVVPPQTLPEAAQPFQQDLQGMGWHVVVSEQEVAVHAFFKNGKMKKSATAGILKREDSATRPYYVFGPDLATARTFGDLNAAMALFIEQARGHAPQSNG